MGQKFRDDKIGTLSHSGGNIVMSASTSNPAYITIGGQQWKVTSSLTRSIATDVTMSANSLYMVYAVRNGGNTELRISSNVNSVGPSGFTSWKLIGAFYSNGLVSVAFGSFVSIDGRPVSSAWAVDPQMGSTQSSGTLMTTGTGGDAQCRAQRDGDKVRLYYYIGRGTSGGTTGTGNPYLFPLPTNLASGGSLWIGDGAGYFAAINGYQTLTAISFGTGVGLMIEGNGSYVGQNVPTANWWTALANTFLIIDVYIPIAGWSNTPIKDL